MSGTGGRTLRTKCRPVPSHARARLSRRDGQTEPVYFIGPILHHPYPFIPKIFTQRISGPRSPLNMSTYSDCLPCRLPKPHSLCGCNRSPAGQAQVRGAMKGVVQIYSQFGSSQHAYVLLHISVLSYFVPAAPVVRAFAGGLIGEGRSISINSANAESV